LHAQLTFVILTHVESREAAQANPD
jgi:hypothetical protein